MYRTKPFRLAIVGIITFAVLSLPVHCQELAFLSKSHSHNRVYSTPKRFYCTLENDEGILELHMLDTSKRHAIERAKEVNRYLTETKGYNLEFKECHEQGDTDQAKD